MCCMRALNLSTRQQPASDDLEFVELGKIVGISGIKGWVKVHSFTRQREDILAYKTWYLGSEQRKRRMIGGRRQGSGIVAHLEGLDDRDAARGCIGNSISISTLDLPPLPRGEYFWTQLEGLEAVDTTGKRLGVVDYLIETGANDVLVIKGGNSEILVPYIPDVVHQVDLDKGFIELDWEIDGNI